MTAELPPLAKLALDTFNLALLCDGSAMQIAAAQRERDKLLAAIAAREATHAAHAGGVEEWGGELRSSSLKARTAKGIVQQVYRRHHGPMERHECEELIRLIDALDSPANQARLEWQDIATAPKESFYVRFAKEWPAVSDDERELVTRFLDGWFEAGEHVTLINGLTASETAATPSCAGLGKPEQTR